MRYFFESKVEKKDVKKPGGAPPDEMAAEP